MHEVLVNHLGGVSQPWKSVVRLTDHPNMTIAVYHGRKTTKQDQQKGKVNGYSFRVSSSAIFTSTSPCCKF